MEPQRHVNVALCVDHFMDLSINIKKKLFFYFHLCLWAVYGIVAQFHVAGLQYWIQPVNRGKKSRTFVPNPG